MNSKIFFKRTFLIVISVFLFCTHANSKTHSTSKKTVTFYVSKDGKDTNAGSYKEPFASIQKAQKAIREFNKTTNKQVKISVIVKGGLYELNTPLLFTPEDSGNEETPSIYKATNNEDVVLSGGKHIQGWKSIGENHWIATLPEVKNRNWIFRQLFAGENRLTRARTPNTGFYRTKGALSKYAKNVNKYKFSKELKENDPAGYWECRAGFQFEDGDIKPWSNWHDAEILTMHSWESSWQSIRRIDLEKNDVYFNSPCRYPVGSFARNMRYRIENIREALDLPGEWYLDGNLGELHLLTEKGQNPNEMNIFAPFLSHFVKFMGHENGEQTKYIQFENIDFKYAKSHMGIYDIAPNWPEEILKGIPDFPKNSKAGFTDSQAAPRCGEAVLFEGAEDIVFENCDIMHVGAYGIKIGARSHRIKINNSNIYDLGGGGVLIGFPIREVEKEDIPFTDAPSYNVISNCHIHKAGMVHPAAVGMWMAQTHHNTISHNEINNISYSGVSNGWTWGAAKNYTKSNLIANNYIHHVAQLLGDAAGIYGLGNCEGTIYKENFLDEIRKGEGVHGVVDAMGFDEHSKNVRIERNVVGNISGKTVSFNKNGPKDHLWIDNNFDLSIERPKFQHNKKLDPENISVFANFNLASSFINVHGGTEHRWILSKNSNANGFYGMLVEGKRVIAFLNIGGGKGDNFSIQSENVLVDDKFNQAAITYNGNVFKLYVNGKLAGIKSIGKKRTSGSGDLIIAPVRANTLRNGIQKLAIYSIALSEKEIVELGENRKPEKTTPTFVWKAPKSTITNINFNKIIKKAGPQKSN